MQPLVKTFTQPPWRGEDVAGKTVLVYAEQGLGDTLQFARYCKQIAARGAKVVLLVQPSVLSLLKARAWFHWKRASILRPIFHKASPR